MSKVGLAMDCTDYICNISETIIGNIICCPLEISDVSFVALQTRLASFPQNQLLHTIVLSIVEISLVARGFCLCVLLS
jgi:hypothetical protein